jgi:hypothetical protein
VPYTLAGETVTAIADGKRAALLSVKTPSPDRIEPVCAHYETCGGCSLQHMAEDAYRTWKADLLAKALAAHDIDTSVIKEAQFCAPRSRRRAVFSAILTEKGVILGFQQAASNHVVDLEECHVIAPEIDAARSGLKTLLETFLPAGKTVHVTVNQTMTGLDIAVEGKIAPKTTGQTRCRRGGPNGRLRAAGGQWRDCSRAEAAADHLRRRGRVAAARRLPAGRAGDGGGHGRACHRPHGEIETRRRPVRRLRHFRAQARQGVNGACGRR